MKETKKEWTKLRNVAGMWLILGIALSVFMWSVTGPAMFTTNLIMSLIMTIPLAGLGWISWLSHKRVQDFE